MKNFFKKLTAIAVAAVMTVPICAQIFAADTASATAADYLTEEQADFLDWLGVVPDTSAEYGKKLTRGEMAHMAAAVANYGEYGKEEIYFYDVPAEHEYFNDIYMLREMGVISGDGDGFYRPDDPVSELEISKVFSVILGYKHIGEMTSFLRTARAAGIMRGVTISGYVTYGQGLRIAYNALHASMMEVDTWGESLSYSANEGLTAIENYWGLVPCVGIMDGIYGTTLVKPDDSIEKGNVVIDGRVFKYEGGDELFGYKVRFYCERAHQASDDVKNVIEYAFRHEDNKTLVVAKEDIEGKNQTSITYLVGDNERSARIDAWTDSVFNGIAYSGYTLDELKRDNGTVTLIDNDDDGVYEVLVEESRQYMKVIANDADNGILTAYKFGNNTKTEVTVGSRDRDMAVSYIQRGKEARASKVKADVIVAVKQSRNTDGIWKVEIEIVSDSATGKVESVGSESITVGGVRYKTNKLTVSDAQAKPGDTVKLYVKNGVAELIVHASSEDYLVGELVSAVVNNKKTFSTEIAIKLVTTARELKVFEGVKKIFIDNVKYTDNMAAAQTALETSAQMLVGSYRSDFPQSQLIRYRVDDTGQITHIDTVNKTASEDEDSLTFYEHAVVNGVVNAKSMFRSTDKTYFCSVENLMPTISVPNDARDEANWYSSTSMNNNDTMTVDAFNVDPDTGVAKYWIYYVGRWSSLGNSELPAIVTEITNELNDEGDIVKKISLKGGSLSSIELEDTIFWGQTGESDSQKMSSDEAFSRLSIGDVILYRMDYKNKCAIRIYKLFSAGDAEIDGKSDRVYTSTSGTPNHNLNNNVYAALGTVYSANSSGFLFHTTSILGDEGVDFNDKSTLKNYYPITKTGTTYYVYDSSRSDLGVRLGSVNDLVSWHGDSQNPDRVFVVVSLGNVKYVYIMK